MFKKGIAMVMMILTVFCYCCFYTSAAEETSAVNEDISLAYLYTQKIMSSLSISSKTATCTSYIVGESGITTKIVVTQYLQKKSGDSWVNVQSWSKTFEQVMVSYKNTKSALSSGNYRTRTVAKVYSGTKYETITSYSTTAVC